MRFYLSIAFLFLVTLVVNAQTKQELDSLHVALKNAANDKIKMSILQELVSHHVESNRDSAAVYTEMGFELSKKINQPLWTARFILYRSSLLQMQGNLPAAIKLTNEAMAMARDPKNELNAYQGEDAKLFVSPRNFRLQKVAGGFNQFGNIYSLASNKQKAVAMYRQSIAVGREIKNLRFLISPYINIGRIYHQSGRLDSALVYSREALKYAVTTDFKLYLGSAMGSIGEIFYKRNQLDSARAYYWLALQVNREQGNQGREIDVHNSLARLHKSLLQVDSMLYYSKGAFKLATQLKSGRLQTTAAELVSDAYKMKGNVDSAFAYLSIAKAFGDTLTADKISKLTEFQNIAFEEQMLLEKKEQENVASKNRLKTMGFVAGLFLLSAIVLVFYRNNRQKQKANKALEDTLANLRSTQAQLIQSEKMASLGELTAGIAHEIQNPLNFVNNFSEVNKELLMEMKDEMDKGNMTDAKAIANDVMANEEKINHHGKRADAIVKGMLQHSSSGSGVKEPTNINALADEYLRLSYHGLRAKDKSFNATMKTEFDETIGNINIIPQDIGRVMLNLFNNAFYAAPLPPPEKNGINSGGFLDPDYFHNPTVWVSTKKMGDKVFISVRDNGPGIPKKILDKIFQPFFTTKPTGQGTGLGLSLSYDIVKAHGGELKVETIEGEGTTFIIKLPIV